MNRGAGRIIDTETASLEAGVCELASVSVDIKGRVIEGTLLDDYVNPEVPISFGAMAIHNITEDMVKGCPNIGSVYKKHTLQGGGYIIAHNASFDLGKLPKDFVSEGQKVLCTLALAKALYPKGSVESHKLGVLYYQFGLYDKVKLTGNFHSAGYDVQVTGAVLEYMLETNGLDLDSAYSLINKPIEHTKCFMKKYRDTGLTWEEVVKKDKPYVQWLINNFSWGYDNDLLLEYLNKNM